MKRRLKKVLALLFVFMTNSSAAIAAEDANSKKIDWNPVMDAIIKVESEGNPRAVSGNSCGAMQITPILVKECNNILKKRKSKKRYKLSDRFSVSKSKEMFLLFQSFYNPLCDVEKAIRSWNGGINYTVKGTQRYFNKVMKNLR